MLPTAVCLHFFFRMTGTRITECKKTRNVWRGWGEVEFSLVSVGSDLHTLMFARPEAILELSTWSCDLPRVNPADWRMLSSPDKVLRGRLPSHELRLVIPYPTSLD